MGAASPVLMMAFGFGAALAVLGYVCGALGLALVRSRRRMRLVRAQLRDVATRAALAESALHDMRARRSAAVAKGNRKRGAGHAELRAQTMAELREAVALRKAGGQRSLPLDSLSRASLPLDGFLADGAQ